MKNSKNLPEIRDLEVLNRPKVGQKKSNFQEKLNLWLKILWLKWAKFFLDGLKCVEKLIQSDKKVDFFDWK